MYLKALEIQGFKSFPEKTRLTFEKPITVIVGPNGSGKSNISDAVSWVLGEQSTKTLRGGKMEDVIFGGTEKRAQLGFAQVSLILDNSSGLFEVEGSEVMVTRRYYRSGESEYYINKQQVRLKDIHELFMDTGLGKEGYSIIGQGKIDNILSEKSTDRREIFEEAAGISRYRHRKEEAERKLQRTNENLLRINDKISELELQVGPLREQAQVAKKYLFLRDELRTLEVSVWLDSLEKLKFSTMKLEQDFTAARQQLDMEHTRMQELYKKTESITERMREKDVEAEALRGEISELEAAAAELDSAIAVLNTNLRNNFESIEQLKSELAEHEGRAGALSEQIQQRKSRIALIEAKKEELNSEMNAFLSDSEQTSASADELSLKVEELLKLEQRERELAAEARERLSALASTLQELCDRGEALRQELSQALDRLENEKLLFAGRETELKAQKEEAEALSNAINGRSMLLSTRQKKAGALADKRSKLKLEINTLGSRIAMLSEMEKEYEGYSKAVRIVMQESSRGTLKRIHGPIANLIKTGDKYALAIETALGASMQSIVVDREEDGKAAIALLKCRDGGRATFLPLTAIKGSLLSERGLDKEEGFEGIAFSLISYDKKYEQIMLNLLGRTVVVEDMDCAIALARKCSHRFRIVTLDGQVINAGGSMTGGSASKSAGILSRANEIIRLKEQEKRLLADISAVEKEYAEAERELNAVRYEMELAEAEKRRLEDAILKAGSELSQHSLLISTLSENCENLRQNIKNISEREEKCEGEIKHTREALAEHERLALEHKAQAEELMRGRDELISLAASLSEKLSAIRTEQASLEAERLATEQAITELEGLQEAMTGDRAQRALKIDELKAQNEQIVSELGDKEKRQTELRGKIAESKKRLTETVNLRFGLESERERVEKESQEKNRDILNLEKEFSRLEQKKLAAEMEEKQIVDKLWDNYGLGRSSAESVRCEIESLPKAQRRIAELRREISALGTPNLGAIEEYERVSERYEFLTSQRDDIEKAKSEIEHIIADVTSEMKSIFKREFEAINERFKETFVELFGGGRASLELEDEDDLLNCGIEIRVQPPGKSLKTLTLLSGGEKAFVAIALFFAILKVKPTPFSVLDEIEAALDEANVQRFAEYLRRMSVKTQFIVITHRRGTMEEADTLYGVTMQEQGVSKILSVDLDEVEKEILTA